jgi:hypothetical protein
MSSRAPRDRLWSGTSQIDRPLCAWIAPARVRKRCARPAHDFAARDARFASDCCARDIHAHFARRHAQQRARERLRRAESYLLFSAARNRARRNLLPPGHAENHTPPEDVNRKTDFARGRLVRCRMRPIKRVKSEISDDTSSLARAPGGALGCLVWQWLDVHAHLADQHQRHGHVDAGGRDANLGSDAIWDHRRREEFLHCRSVLLWRNRLSEGRSHRVRALWRFQLQRFG